ncbi:MAG: hypothetical protein ACJ72F_05810, partial [Nitrososphaeraceae archaeon]
MTAIKSVFSPIALLMLATLITGATSFQTTLAQPIMADSNMSMGNRAGRGHTKEKEKRYPRNN